MTDSDHVMRLLAAGVPLSLLLDLAPPGGPDSRAILRVEEAMLAADAAGPPARWLRPAHAAGADPRG